MGGAVGDALGAPVEFMARDAILARFGPDGIRDYAPAYGLLGAITDDTQMTLFTVEGIIRAGVRFATRGICNPIWVMRYAYERWLATQKEPLPEGHSIGSGAQGWLYPIPALHSRRAPGNTCVSALRQPPQGDWAMAQNDSKGCGGVMRVAPIGLMARDPYDYGSKAAAITHGHPLGYQTAGIMALLVAEALQADRLESVIDPALARVPEEAGEAAAWVRRAADLALSDRPAIDCIEALGQGWVAEEALAIGVFAALRGETFEEAVVIAVNHSGDSDSTGSIAGQLRGTVEGKGAIPARWLEELELRDEIERAADDLYDWTHESPIRTSAGYAEVPDEWWARYPGG